MKKVLKISLCTIIMIVVAIFSFGCAKKDPVDFTGLAEKDLSVLQVAEGLDSYDLYMQLAENYRAETNIKVIFNLSFNSVTLGIPISQYGQETIIRSGNEVYFKKISVGSGFAKANDAEEFFAVKDNNDGKIRKISDEKKVVMNDDGSFSADLDGVAWGNQGEANTRYNTYKNFTNSYVWLKEGLAQEHDSKVYLENGIYYATATIRTIGTVEDGSQPGIKKEIEDGISTPGKSDGEVLEWLQNTPIKFACEKVNGKFRILALYKLEKYKGKARGINAEAVHTTHRTFLYDAESTTITNAQRPN